MEILQIVQILLVSYNRYNLKRSIISNAQSHVAVSFETPEYTANSCLGTLRLLEAIRLLGLSNKTKYLSSKYKRIVWVKCKRFPKRDNSFLS